MSTPEVCAMAVIEKAIAMTIARIPANRELYDFIESVIWFSVLLRVYVAFNVCCVCRVVPSKISESTSTVKNQNSSINSLSLIDTESIIFNQSVLRSSIIHF